MAGSIGSFIILAILIGIPLYIAGKVRQRKQDYYNSLDTNEKILYNIEEVNNKTPGVLEELVWSILGMAFGLWLVWFMLYSIFN